MQFVYIICSNDTVAKYSLLSLPLEAFVHESQIQTQKAKCSVLNSVRLNVTNMTIVTGILPLLVQQARERKNTVAKDTARLEGILPLYPLEKAQN
jgi:hypothetical protein